MASETAVRLHSRYQPQLEAERYIEALNPRRDIDYYIVIEPGLGYLFSALQKYCPDSKIIALHADTAFQETASHEDIPAWFPDSGKSAQEFLEETIPETASARIIEWRPSLSVYGDVYLDLVRESTEFIKRSEASRRTGAAFGRRWVRNFFRNLTLMRRTLLYQTMDMPIVITGSGPSLEAALSQIRAARDGVFVLAASSSLPALAAGGVTPNMVISTDGGGWALTHLYACFRGGEEWGVGSGEWGVGNKERTREQRTGRCGVSPLRGGAEDRHRRAGARGETSPYLPYSLLPTPHSLSSPYSPLLAFALSAALPSQCSEMPLLPMSDGSLWQNIALHGIGVPSAFIPQRGTVTASALELAMLLSSGNIFLAGMDLATRDIASHARPYGFDHLFFGTASRFRPLYSQCFIRSSDIRAGGSHDVYAAWFKNKIASLPTRIFSLGDNHPNIAHNLPAASLQGEWGVGSGEWGVGREVSTENFKVITTNGYPAERCKCAAETIIAALDNAQYTVTLTGELAPLLFPSQPDVSAGEIAEAIRGIAQRYWGECG